MTYILKTIRSIVEDPVQTALGKVLAIAELFEEEAEDEWESGYEYGFEDGKYYKEVKESKVPLRRQHGVETPYQGA